jgi:hypothetical protein
MRQIKSKDKKEDRRKRRGREIYDCLCGSAGAVAKGSRNREGS